LFLIKAGNSDANILCDIDAGKRIRDGVSGTWVTSPWTRGFNGSISVYGQVVADDIFGDVYMISLPDIMDDIKTLTGAAGVRLPRSLKELQELLSNQRGREEADQPGTGKASSRPVANSGSYRSVRLKKPFIATGMENPLITAGMTSYPQEHDSNISPGFPKSEEDSNTITQSDGPWNFPPSAIGYSRPPERSAAARRYLDVFASDDDSDMREVSQASTSKAKARRGKLQ